MKHIENHIPPLSQVIRRKGKVMGMKGWGEIKSVTMMTAGDPVCC